MLKIDPVHTGPIINGANDALWICLSNIRTNRVTLEEGPKDVVELFGIGCVPAGVLIIKLVLATI